MMPNKTIYVKDADVPLFEHAQALLGDSVSSMFAEFLKERVGKVKPEERMTESINQISRMRKALKNEAGLAKLLNGIYGEAEAYARRALKNLRAGRIKEAKMLYYAANAYLALAEHNAKEMRALEEKITGVLGT